MKLANSQYIKLDKFSIFSELVKATDEKNNAKMMFFKKLLQTITKYEKERKQSIDTIYISLTDLRDSEIFKILELSIERQLLLNATIFAMYNGDIEIAKNLTSFFSEREVHTNELGELSSYVLEHSINMDEFIEGERERIIYNKKENKIENGYIFLMKNCSNKKTLKQKKL